MVCRGSRAPVLDDSPLGYPHNVKCFAVDLLATMTTPPPPDPGDGAIANTDLVLNRNLLMFVRDTACPNDMGETINASDRPCPQSLMVQAVVRDDRRCLGWVAGREHRHHRLKQICGGEPLRDLSLADDR